MPKKEKEGPCPYIFIVGFNDSYLGPDRDFREDLPLDHTFKDEPSLDHNFRGDLLLEHASIIDQRSDHVKPHPHY